MTPCRDVRLEDRTLISPMTRIAAASEPGIQSEENG
jgi:hypothetical protein